MDSDLHSHVHLLARGTRRPEPSRPSRLYPDYAKESIPAAPRNAGTQARERDHGIGGRRAAGPPDTGKGTGRMEGFVPPKVSGKSLIRPRTKSFANSSQDLNSSRMRDTLRKSKTIPSRRLNLTTRNPQPGPARLSGGRGPPGARASSPRTAEGPSWSKGCRRSRECGGPNLSALRNQEDECRRAGVPRGSRTPVAAVKGRCPGPLDDGDELRFVGRGRPHLAPAAVDLVEPGGIEPPTSTMPL